MSVHRHKKI